MFITGPCAILNGDCEHICIPIGRNRICRCKYGFNLDSNKEMCSSSKYYCNNCSTLVNEILDSFAILMVLSET